MIVFLDTEFTDALDCDLISIGMISENGLHEIYLERNDYRSDWCNPFVQAAVLPQLGQIGNCVNRQDLSNRLAEWLSSIPEEITIACDNYVDWELLIDCLGEVRPANLLAKREILPVGDQIVFNHAVVEYHERNGGWHHALHDARAYRQGWLASQKL